MTVASVAAPRLDSPRSPSRSATVIAAEQRGRGEREQDRGHAARPPHEPDERAAAAGSASTIPAMITAQPSQPTAPSRSPASVKPKNAAQTGSSENASAVCVALVRRCAQVWARNASALAKTPVTISAPQTVQPCGTAQLARRASATTSSPTKAASHLDERERERVVARREALHQDDLERVDGGARRARAGRRRASRRGRRRAARARPSRARRRPTPRAPIRVAEEQQARAAASARRTSR